MTLSRAFQASGLLSTPQAAKRLNVSRSAVWLYIKSGQLAHERIGAWFGVSPQAIADFEAKYPEAVSPNKVRPSKGKKAGPKPKRGAKKAPGRKT